MSWSLKLMAGRKTSRTTRFWLDWRSRIKNDRKRKSAGWSAGCGPTIRFPASLKASTSRRPKRKAQVAAELLAAVEQKQSFPPGAVEQTAAVFAALAAASAPLDAKGLAEQFKRTKTEEDRRGVGVASLARLGYVTSEDGNAFVLRRVA